MNDSEIRIFLSQLDELIDQSMTDKSHYYTAKVLKKCSVLITELWAEHLRIEQVRSLIE